MCPKTPKNNQHLSVKDLGVNEVIRTKNEPITKKIKGTSVTTSLIVEDFSVERDFGGSLVRMIRFAITNNPRSMNATALINLLIYQGLE